MSGVVELKVDDLNNILDSYSVTVGTHAIKYNQEVQDVLSYDTVKLKSLTEEECCQCSFILAQYSLFLQKEYNRSSARYKWAQHNLNVYVGKNAANYGTQYTKYEEKKALIICENEFAKKLAKIMVDSEILMEELSFIASRVDTMSKILSEYQKTKRGYRYANS